MITFLMGILILIFGYLFYSKYVEKQFSPDDRKTPAYEMQDGLDFVPISKRKNMLIQLLNIAGLGPILGAIQGIMFGPVAFLIIPTGAIFMGCVHDYFAGMLSVRNNGAQIPDLIKKYLGNSAFRIFVILVTLMLLLLAAVFVYTAGDIIAEGFFNQTNFSLSNPVIITIYLVIALYFILATMLPIDKIIGKLYPAFAIMLILGSAFILFGIAQKGYNIPEINFAQLNLSPRHFAIIPMFFITVSCGLLSGFHSTQSTLISRTLEHEKQGRDVFYGMMCLESLIAMIWALAAYCIYLNHIGNPSIYGTSNMINAIANHYTIPLFAALITISAVILPITSGDTALRSLRLTLADSIKLPQEKKRYKLLIIIPIIIGLFGIIVWAKMHSDSFGMIWRYFDFVNLIIAVATFLVATVYLYKNKKNYFMTLIPGLFYTFITTTFICVNSIGFDLPTLTSKIIGCLMAIVILIFVTRKMRK